MSDFLPEDLLKEIDKAKGVKDANKKLADNAYKEAIKADENLSTLKLKIWLLSREGDWVEAGTFGFTTDKLKNIADFVRDIVLENVPDVRNYLIKGSITVKYSVIDETSGDIKLQNTIKIAVPKDYLEQVKEEKREEVKEKVEEGIWEGLSKFIELNKNILDTAIQAKEIEKQSLASIFQQQLELVNKKMEELQSKLLKGEIKGEDKTLALALSFMTQLQKLRDEYERRLMELLTKQMKVQQEIQEEKLKHQLELQKLQQQQLLKELQESKQKDDNEMSKITYELLKSLVEVSLKQTIEKDPLHEVKEIAQLIKELKDKDTGEDIKEKLSQTVINLTQKKLSEDPLEDLASKIKILKEVLKEISGDKEEIKQEVKNEIEQLRNLIMTMQMQQAQPELPLLEQEKDPLEKLEEETERIARIYQRMEKLFGKREPAGKTVLDTIKELLSSPTIVKLAEVIGQVLIQAEQMKMQAPPMPYGYYYPQPMPVARPINHARVVRKRIVKRPQRVVHQQPVQQPQQFVQQPQPIVQQIPQTVPPQPQQVEQPVQQPQQPQPQQQPQQEDFKVEIRRIIDEELIGVIKAWKSEKRKGGTQRLKKLLIDKVLEIERNSQILQRIFVAGQVDLLQEFRADIDNLIEQELKMPKEEAVKFADEIITEVVEKLAQGG